jgi:hypothetical protein
MKDLSILQPKTLQEIDKNVKKSKINLSELNMDK